MRSTNKVDFDDYEMDTIEYNFQGSEEVAQFMRGTQTPIIDYEDAATSTKLEGRSVKVQITEEVISAAIRPKKDQQDDTNDINNNQQLQSDLADFLRRVYPLVDRELSTNIKALEQYEPLWTDQRKEISCLYSLSNALNRMDELNGQLEITELSWNCTGLILAAAYGKLEHKGTSNEKSYVCVWNLSKRNFQQDKPSLIIETEVSITTIEFHPSKPSLLAGGSFNGEVFLWDLQDEEENLVAKSQIDEYFHREAVTQLHWVEHKKPGVNAMQQYLLSLSTDGKILQWNMNYEDNESKLQLLKFPVKGYYLLRKREGDIVSVGGLCFAQSNEDKNAFIVGSEGGSVVRALLSNQLVDPKNKSIIEQQSGSSKLQWKSSSMQVMMGLFNKNLMDVKMHVEQYCGNKGIRDIEADQIFSSKPEIRKLYLNPVQAAYEPHLGPVYSVDFSPFSRNIFLTASLDGSVKLFDLTQVKSMFSVDSFGNYIFKAQWSPKRPSVFGCCASSGEVAFYDLLHNKKQPLAIVDSKVHRMELGTQALCLKFNYKQTDLVAVAYSKCQVKIYQLSDNLITPRKDEFSLFVDLIEEMKNS